MFLKDVTLREGDQMPGRSYSVQQKVAAGRKLDRLGVNFIQAGFPATGQKDREVLSTLAADVDAEVVGLARALDNDVTAAIEANADIIELLVAVSNTQLKHALEMSRQEMLRRVDEALTSVTDAGRTPHLIVIDAFRTENQHLKRVVDRYSDVPIITLADTVGAKTPASVRTKLEGLSSMVDLSRVGVHFHDDIGVATANALTAMELGVANVDVSVAGLGERAGNTALEQLVVAAKTNADQEIVNIDKLIPTCKSVLSDLKESITPRRPILGSDATTHEAGIHTAAMLNEPDAFEPFAPEVFGGERRLFFGSATGARGARKLLELADVEETEARVSELLEELGEGGPLDKQSALEVARQVARNE